MEDAGELEFRTKRLGRVIAALDATLDWARLGQLYCSEGGEDFFCEDQRDALAESGLEFAHDLAARLTGSEELVDTPASASSRSSELRAEQEDRGRPRTSLYLGAAVFELLPALFEHLVLDRRVVLVNLAHEESAELNRGLALVEEQLGHVLPRIDVRALEDLTDSSFDHVWMTSVLTDPDAFPALHDHVYDRLGSELATNEGDLESELESAGRLLEALLERVATPFWFTTTDEELPLVREKCRARSLELLVPQQGRLSGIVGDPVRHCYVVEAPEPAEDTAN